MQDHLRNHVSDRSSKTGSAYQTFKPRRGASRAVLVFAVIGMVTCALGVAFLACVIFGA